MSVVVVWLFMQTELQPIIYIHSYLFTFSLYFTIHFIAEKNLNKIVESFQEMLEERKNNET